jgi:hypothetical protein
MIVEAPEIDEPDDLPLHHDELDRGWSKLHEELCALALVIPGLTSRCIHVRLHGIAKELIQRFGVMRLRGQHDVHAL